jgi:hypothetical protein
MIARNNAWILAGLLLAIVLLSAWETPTISVGLSSCAGTEPIVCADDGHSVSPALSSLPHAARGDDVSNGALPESPGAARGQTGDIIDPVLQDRAGERAMPAATTFAGISSPGNIAPPDSNGDIGPNHYVQVVNSRMAVYSRAGALLAGPININSIWTGATGQDICRDKNEGEPVVLYDAIANRWFATQWANISLKQCIAISTTPDPTGTWCRYQFPFSTTLLSSTLVNDYGKFGVWPDGYYGTFNVLDFTVPSGSAFVRGAAVVYERSQMLSCLEAREQIFEVPTTESAHGMLPSDVDGATMPPAGAPNYFFNSETLAIPASEAHIWEFHADWATPANSTFGIGSGHTPNQTLAVGSFDGNLCAFSRDCIPQPGTVRKLETLAGLTMFRLQYRNFESHESLVTNLTVDAGGDHAAPRWYEFRKTVGAWAVQNQGTFAPDANHRWLGSAAMDRQGNLAVGYSVSSTTTFPSLRYAGRFAADPANLLSQGESTFIAGGGSQTALNRWGGFSAMSVDPVDDCTFWFTGEYYATTSAVGWATRIGSFKFPGCSAAPPPDPCPGPATITMANVGANGYVYCGVTNGLNTPTLRGPGGVSDSVTAIFWWSNPAQQFKFWFRGFPSNFQTLTSLEPMNYYFFQAATTGGTIANTGGTASLAASGTGSISTVAGANAAIWSGGPRATNTLGTYPSITPVTAIFSWNNALQQFNFWFRGFPVNFQTLTVGIERGKYYFFQAPAGATIPMN